MAGYSSQYIHNLTKGDLIGLVRSQPEVPWPTEVCAWNLPSHPNVKELREVLRGQYGYGPLDSPSPPIARRNRAPRTTRVRRNRAPGTTTGATLNDTAAQLESSQSNAVNDSTIRETAGTAQNLDNTTSTTSQSSNSVINNAVAADDTAGTARGPGRLPANPISVNQVIGAIQPSMKPHVNKAVGGTDQASNNVAKEVMEIGGAVQDSGNTLGSAMAVDEPEGVTPTSKNTTKDATTGGTTQIPDIPLSGAIKISGSAVSSSTAICRTRGATQNATEVVGVVLGPGDTLGSAMAADDPETTTGDTITRVTDIPSGAAKSLDGTVSGSTVIDRTGCAAQNPTGISGNAMAVDEPEGVTLTSKNTTKDATTGGTTQIPDIPLSGAVKISGSAVSSSTAICRTRGATQNATEVVGVVLGPGDTLGSAMAADDPETTTGDTITRVTDIPSGAAKSLDGAVSGSTVIDRTGCAAQNSTGISGNAMAVDEVEGAAQISTSTATGVEENAGAGQDPKPLSDNPITVDQTTGAVHLQIKSSEVASGHLNDVSADSATRALHEGATFDMQFWGGPDFPQLDPPSLEGLLRISDDEFCDPHDQFGTSPATSNQDIIPPITNVDPMQIDFHHEYDTFPVFAVQQGEKNCIGHVTLKTHSLHTHKTIAVTEIQRHVNPLMTCHEYRVTVSIDHSEVVIPIYHVGRDALAISEVTKDEVKLQTSLDIIVLIGNSPGVEQSNTAIPNGDAELYKELLRDYFHSAPELQGELEEFRKISFRGLKASVQLRWYRWAIDLTQTLKVKKDWPNHEGDRIPMKIIQEFIGRRPAWFTAAKQKLNS